MERQTLFVAFVAIILGAGVFTVCAMDNGDNADATYNVIYLTGDETVTGSEMTIRTDGVNIIRQEYDSSVYGIDLAGIYRDVEHGSMVLVTRGIQGDALAVIPSMSDFLLYACASNPGPGKSILVLDEQYATGLPIYDKIIPRVTVAKDQQPLYVIDGYIYPNEVKVGSSGPSVSESTSVLPSNSDPHFHLVVRTSAHGGPTYNWYVGTFTVFNPAM